MFESFVLALREGVEAALVVCVLLATLRRTGRGTLAGAVHAGLGAAVVASVVLAATFARFRIDPENETVEGSLLLVSALFVGSMAVWMHRHGRRLKSRIERRVETLPSGGPALSAKVGVFLFTFLMVGREGVELVLFLAAVTWNTEAVLALLGALLGISLAVLLGVAFLRGSLRVDLRAFFAVTTLMLLVLAAELLASSFHEFVEAGAIPLADPERYMRLVGPMVRNRPLFVAAMILLPLALFVARRRRAPDAPTGDENPAERRKRLALASRERRWRVGFSALSLLALAALGASAVRSARAMERAPAVTLEPRDGLVRVPLEDLEEGRLRCYAVSLADRTVRFLALRVAGEARTALDACALCRDAGYAQPEGRILCLNCVAEIHPPSFGLPGGCNPVPLPSRANGDALEIAVADLEAGKYFFRASETALLECPFCRMRFAPSEAGPAVEFDGRRVRVCSMTECAERSLASGAPLR